MAVSFRYEGEIRKKGFQLIAGVDEAGRGPLAGPVVAAAVIFPQKIDLKGLDDSKKLSPQKRESLYPMIIDQALSFGIGVVSEKRIDSINILNATHEAMRRAVSLLSPDPDFLLIDGKHAIKGLNTPARMIVSGDARSSSIAAASIIAKVTRDNIMKGFHRQYPHYGFISNMGYATEEHLAALTKYGPSPVHRMTFEPVAASSSEQPVFA